MQSEAPLTLIFSPLRAGRGELERTCLGSLRGDPDTVPLKVPLSLPKRERVRVRVRFDCLDAAKGTVGFARWQNRVPATIPKIPAGLRSCRSGGWQRCAPV